MYVAKRLITPEQDFMAAMSLGLQHCDAIPRLIDQYNMSKVDAALAGPGPVFLVSPFTYMTGSHEKTEDVLRNATMRLLGYYDKAAGVIGRAACVESDDIWKIDGDEALNPAALSHERRKPQATKEDGLLGFIGAISLNHGAVGIWPHDSDKTPENMVWSTLTKVVREDSKRYVVPVGRITFVESGTQGLAAGKQVTDEERDRVVKSGRMTMLETLGVALALDTKRDDLISEYGKIIKSDTVQPPARRARRSLGHELRNLIARNR